MADNGSTITVANKRKSGAVDVKISQQGQKTVEQRVNAGTIMPVTVYPGKDSLEVVALDCRQGEKITVTSEKHPEQSKTKDAPPYDFDFTLDIPEKGGGADATEDNIEVLDDEGNPA